MWPYNQSVYPPAPFLDVVLHHPANPQVTQSFPAKVDTGADISAIPLSAVDEFNLSRASTIPVEGYDGQLSTVPTYAIGLYIADTYFGRLEVISIPVCPSRPRRSQSLLYPSERPRLDLRHEHLCYQPSRPGGAEL